MRFRNTQVWGFEHAIRGMRNPKESWAKSDSKYAYTYTIGKNDMTLAQSLIRGGSEHRKFLRQIFVSVDITAPMYWWSEFDTYKVGTVANSTSKMHKIASRPITIDCFEIDDYQDSLVVLDNADGQLSRPIGACVETHINTLEKLRQTYLNYVQESRLCQDEEMKNHLKTVAKSYWKELIRWLPESWLQTRTVTLSYENIFAMCSKGQRRFHKLNEWSGQDNNMLENFVSWARKLPYAQELIFLDELTQSENTEMEQLREVILKLTNNQIDIKYDPSEVKETDKNMFKPMSQVLLEIAKVFES